MLDIPRIREDFPALQHGIYLHTAGIGMNARPVLAEVTDRWQFFFENGPWLQSRRDERFCTSNARGRRWRGFSTCLPIRSRW